MKNFVGILSSIGWCLIVQNANAWTATCHPVESNNNDTVTVEVQEQNNEYFAKVSGELLPCHTEASGDFVCRTKPNEPSPGRAVCGGVSSTFTVSATGEMTFQRVGWGMAWHIQNQYTCTR